MTRKDDQHPEAAAPPVVFRRMPPPEVGPGTRSAFLGMPASRAWTEPVLSFWELSAAGWEDCHPHSETTVVLEGVLHVESAGTEVVLRAGDIAVVPAGSTGRYWAPEHARMVGIYGPNPTGQPTPPGRGWPV